MAAHRKACWVDVTDPKEQAYAEKRRQTRLDAMRAAVETSVEAKS
jgi:hypothetical protein